jgi:uncharacterized OsmC-like protein
MAHFEGKYEGGLRTQNRHIKSGSIIQTDAPVDNHGKGEAFSPTDTVAMALAACAVTTMGIFANKEGLNIDGITYQVDKIMNPSPRKIAEVKIHFQLKNHTLSKEQQAQLIKIAENCPVALSLSPELKQTLSFEF